MKDLYSFHRDEKDLDGYFNKVLKAYDNIFKRCGLSTIKSEASGGVFTKEKTYEYQVLSEVGEDKIIYCPKCNWATNLDVAKVKPGEKCPACKGRLVRGNSIEVGHTFKLGTKYSEVFDLNFVDKKGEKKPVIMGCYGIGLGRLMGTIVEINNDKDGIIWPEGVAPFQVHLIQIKDTPNVKKAAEKLYKDLSSFAPLKRSFGGSTEAFGVGGQEKGIEVLYDDRDDRSPGEKFAEADLIGIPYRIVISERTLGKDSVEIKKRDKEETELMKIKNLSQFLKPQ